MPRAASGIARAMRDSVGPGVAHMCRRCWDAFRRVASGLRSALARSTGHETAQPTGSASRPARKPLPTLTAAKAAWSFLGCTLGMTLLTASFNAKLRGVMTSAGAT